MIDTRKPQPAAGEGAHRLFFLYIMTSAREILMSLRLLLSVVIPPNLDSAVLIDMLQD